MSRKNRIQPSAAKAGARLTALETEDSNGLPVLFSFERVQNGDYCFSTLDKEDKNSVAEALFRRKNMTWNDVMFAPKHGLGTEKIPLDAIKAARPRFLTPDVNDVLAFRYAGKKPMVGHRDGRIFYILWFDKDFTLYSHG